MSVPPARPGSLRVATVLGAPLYLSSSWFLGLLLIGAIYLTQTEGLEPGLQALVVATALASLVVAVLAHELAHALVARACGHRVHAITLTMFGGATQHSSPRPRPLTSALIALSGPLTNLAIAGVAWGLLRSGALAAGAPALAGSSVLWINLALGVFNALPGLPMDGGQALAALVWAATGSPAKGTVVAAWTGRVVAVGVIAYYGYQTMSGATSTASFIWAVLIALMLWNGAGASLRAAQGRAELDKITARDATVPAHLVPDDLTAGEAFRRTPSLEQWLVLVHQGQVTGVVAPTVLTADVEATPVSQLARPVPPEVVDLAPDAGVADVLTSMVGSGHERVVVRFPSGEPRVLELSHIIGEPEQPAAAG